MATTTAPNQRASLLSGLRTGGVRSTSATVPHTAAPGGSFNIPRFVSASYGQSYPEEDEVYDDDEYDDDAQLADLAARNMRFGGNGNGQPPRMQLHPPLTAAVDGSQNRFAIQQQHTVARNHHQMAALGLGAGMNIPNPHMHAQQQQQQQQQQALQMQMMQIEMLRLQAIQAQQYQAELFAQAQFQQQQQQRSYQPPASAGPLATSFGSSQLRRPSQAELLRTQLGLDDQQQQMQVPMTAALGGKFGGRLQIATEYDEFPGARSSYASPMTPTPTQANHTGVISGGAALGGGNGGGNGGGQQQQQQQQPSKSDSAVSWRRSSTNHSVLRRSPPPAMPDVKITPPPLDTSSLPTSNRGSPSPNPLSSTGQPRTRPSPLRFSPPTVGAASPIIAISGSGAGSTADESEEDGSASEPSSGKSSPATPQSQSPPLPPSPRDGKAYDSLGLGRPNQGPIQVAIQRVNRQPRGPPAGADELGPKNFAARIRKRAIGGLGALLENRERREDVVGA